MPARQRSVQLGYSALAQIWKGIIMYRNCSPTALFDAPVVMSLRLLSISNNWAWHAEQRVAYIIHGVGLCNHQVMQPALRLTYVGKSGELDIAIFGTMTFLLSALVPPKTTPKSANISHLARSKHGELYLHKAKHHWDNAKGDVNWDLNTPTLYLSRQHSSLELDNQTSWLIGWTSKAPCLQPVPHCLSVSQVYTRVVAKKRSTLSAWSLRRIAALQTASSSQKQKAVALTL